MANKVQFQEALKTGASLLGKTIGWQILFFIVFGIIAVILSAIVFGIAAAIGSTIIFAVVGIILAFLLFPLFGGVFNLIDDAHLRGKVDFGESFKGFQFAIPLTITLLITFLIQGILYGTFGYILIGPDGIQEWFDLMKSYISSIRSGSMDVELMESYQLAIEETTQKYMLPNQLASMVAGVVGTLFIFPALYVLRGGHSLGSALSKGLSDSFSNFGPIAALYVAYSAAILLLNYIPVVGPLVVGIAGMPFLYSLIVAIYRQMNPADSGSEGYENEQIIDA